MTVFEQHINGRAFGSAILLLATVWVAEFDHPDFFLSVEILSPLSGTTTEIFLRSTNSCDKKTYAAVGNRTFRMIVSDEGCDVTVGCSCGILREKESSAEFSGSV